MRRLRATHTYATMAVSEPAYGEIREKLLQAAYDHVIDGGGSEETIDMHGIALQIEVNEKQGAKPPMQSTPRQIQGARAGMELIEPLATRLPRCQGARPPMGRRVLPRRGTLALQTRHG